MLEGIANQLKGSELSCEKCGENKFLQIELLGKMQTVARICKCEKAQNEIEDQANKNRESQIRLENLFKNSLMDSAFYEKTFENWDSAKGSERLYKIGTKYVEKFKELKSSALGLLIHGEPGNGKTYLSCCIANRLLKNYTPVICVSINGLLSRIKETYSKWGDEAEADVINGLGKADLLIIDDLGTEKITEWSGPMIYNIIDSRYRSKLPLIVTTNIQIDTSKTNGILADKYGRRTEDRIFEMCTPIQNSGKSIRLEEAKRKTGLLNSLFKEG
jgi:DNA replication protein DnaC